MNDDKTINLFGENDMWKEEWVDMPEFVQEEVEPYQIIIMRFRCKEDVESFSKLINQKIYETTKSLWYPKLLKRMLTLKRWEDK
jgi:hypothetical protein